MTTEAITATFAGVVLLFNAWAVWRQREADKKATASALRIEEVQTEVAAVSQKQDETLIMVNGPLSAALKTTAETLEILADIKGDDVSIMKAIEARKESDEHAKTREDAARVVSDKSAAELKAIRDFKHRKDPKPVAQPAAPPSAVSETGPGHAIPVTISTTIKRTE